MKTPGTVEILGKLVAFPTVSRDPNLPLIDWVRNFLADQGVESHLVPDDTGRKSNLYASIGPPVAGGIVMSGHSDVVPVDGQAWQSDPFQLTPRDSRLHARGACDMKGFIAAALSRVPALVSMRLAKPVHLMFSYDEEIGCLGAPRMIDAARSRILAPAAVIVGEPTSMRVANEHKGICTARTSVTGIEAHSSLTHQGISAVMIAAELVEHLAGIAKRLGQAPRSERAKRFVPPFTTASVNTIRGGTATNILAAACEFTWDVRSLPGDRAASVLEEFTSRCAQRLAELEAHGGLAESLARAMSATEQDSITVPFATEGGQFQRAGWSTVVCGPGSIEQAHKPDEFIERSELQACEGFLERMIERQCRA